MDAPRAAPSPDDVAARVQNAARRAGGAWNRQSTTAVRETLMIARELRVQRVMFDYGGLRFRFDLQLDGANNGYDATEVEQPFGGGGDVQMGDGVVENAPAPARATAPTAATSASARRVAHGTVAPAVAQVAAAPGATALSAADIAVLSERAATAAARRKRQKAARKAREQAALLLAAQSASTAVPAGQVHVPAWSTTMDQREAFVRLVGETTEKMTNHARNALGGRSTATVSARYGGRDYSVAVISGTAAVTMTAEQRGEELLALLGSGLQTGDLTTLCSRWSRPRTTGSILT